PRRSVQKASDGVDAKQFGTLDGLAASHPCEPSAGPAAGSAGWPRAPRPPRGPRDASATPRAEPGLGSRCPPPAVGVQRFALPWQCEGSGKRPKKLRTATMGSILDRPVEPGSLPLATGAKRLWSRRREAFWDARRAARVAVEQAVHCCRPQAMKV